MRVRIILAILTAVLHVGLRYYITPPLGEDVKDRFIERDKFIPSLKNGAGQDGGRLLTCGSGSTILGTSPPAKAMSSR